MSSDTNRTDTRLTDSYNPAEIQQKC